MELEEENILMVGVAPGYKAAAELNGIKLLSINVRQEIKSWEEFPEAVQRLKDGMYHEYGCRMSEKFLVNLLCGGNLNGRLKGKTFLAMRQAGCLGEKNI
jgi:hypothetical protein